MENRDNRIVYFSINKFDIKKIFEKYTFDIIKKETTGDWIEKNIKNKHYDNISKKHIIYNYISNPEEIVIVNNNESKREFFLSIKEEELELGIYDIFGRKLNIKTCAQLTKFKAEFYLYKDLIEEFSNDKKRIEVYMNSFFEKWYL